MSDLAQEFGLRAPGGAGAGPAAKAVDCDPLRGDDRARAGGSGTHRQAGRAGDAPPVSHLFLE